MTRLPLAIAVLILAASPALAQVTTDEMIANGRAFDAELRLQRVEQRERDAEIRQRCIDNPDFWACKPLFPNGIHLPTLHLPSPRWSSPKPAKVEDAAKATTAPAGGAGQPVPTAVSRY